MGDMENIYPELALYGTKNECARIDTVFFPISEVSKGTVSLTSLVPKLWQFDKLVDFAYRCITKGLDLQHSSVVKNV